MFIRNYRSIMIVGEPAKLLLDMEEFIPSPQE
jgi:hypothetical protein